MEDSQESARSRAWNDVVQQGFVRLGVFPCDRVQRLAEDRESEVRFLSAPVNARSGTICSERVPRSCSLVTMRSMLAVDHSHPRFVIRPLPEVYIADQGVELPDQLGAFLPARVRGPTREGGFAEVAGVVVWIYAQLVSGPVEIQAEKSIGAVLVFFAPFETVFAFHDGIAEKLVIARVKSRPGSLGSKRSA